MHPLDAAIDGLRHAIAGFGPTECLFDAFAVSDRQRIAFVPSGAAVDR